jgi:hypothetical protein
MTLSLDEAASFFRVPHHVIRRAIAEGALELHLTPLLDWVYGRDRRCGEYDESRLLKLQRS